MVASAQIRIDRVSDLLNVLSKSNPKGLASMLRSIDYSGSSPAQSINIIESKDYVGTDGLDRVMNLADRLVYNTVRGRQNIPRSRPNFHPYFQLSCRGSPFPLGLCTVSLDGISHRLQTPPPVHCEYHVQHEDRQEE